MLNFRVFRKPTKFVIKILRTQQQFSAQIGPVKKSYERVINDRRLTNWPLGCQEVQTVFTFFEMKSFLQKPYFLYSFEHGGKSNLSVLNSVSYVEKNYLKMNMLPSKKP